MGIPLALLTIADIGMFLNRMVKKLVSMVGAMQTWITKHYEQQRLNRSHASGSVNGSVSLVKMKNRIFGRFVGFFEGTGTFKFGISRTGNCAEILNSREMAII